MNLVSVIDEFSDETAAVLTAGGDRFINTVAHLLYFHPPLFILLHRVVVYMLTLCTHLVAECDMSPIKACTIHLPINMTYQGRKNVTKTRSCALPHS